MRARLDGKTARNTKYGTIHKLRSVGKILPIFDQAGGIASIYLKPTIFATADFCDLNRQTVIAKGQII